ncbi:zinc ribbon domain-containing protein [Candidatus Bathyarchaeota archaeon]|nr:zinc ribbon domain-containing protein [Candidatus Bathyarchaeota archaeon]
MAKKGISVWLFSSLTVISIAHLIDAFFALVLNSGIRLLQLYPLVGDKLQSITPIAYFWISAAASLILWGITCVIAFTNPVEAFLNKILSDAKTQTAVEAQLLEEKGEILDVMSETIESNNQILANVKDIIYNIRTEVKSITPLNESIEKMKTEISTLKKEIKKLEEKLYFPIMCPACGKPLMPEFKMCPYCGEDMKLHQTSVIALKEYK